MFPQKPSRGRQHDSNEDNIVYYTDGRFRRRLKWGVFWHYYVEVGTHLKRVPDALYVLHTYME